MPNLKPLLLLHGALGSQANFEALVALASNDFSIHTLNFEGHGGGLPLERPFRMEHFVENVLAYLDAHALSTIDIFGYSMGGYVALLLAHLYPARVGKIFTLATKLDWNPTSAAREAQFLDADKILAKVPRYAEALQALHGDHWRLVLEKTAEMMLDLGQKPRLNTDIYETIQHRVRVSLGDKDTMVSIGETLAAFHQLPNAEFQVFPHTPHPIDRVDPALVWGALKEFFA